MDTEVRRRKLKFRAGHRGLKELDLFLGAFAEARIGEMTISQLDEFERILELPDNTVLDWITGRSSPPAERAGPVLVELLKFDFFATTRN